jgi:hypothetical protein
MKRSTRLGWFLALATAIGGAAAPAADVAARRPASETAVGIEGVYYLRHRGPAVEALPVNDDSPVVLRIADAAGDGGATIYELRYIGVKPGRYDLRNYLRRADGGPMTGVEPISVSIRSALPDDHNGQLDVLPCLPLPTAWPYRLFLAVVGGLWFVPLAWFMVRRVVRRKRRPKAPPSGEPSLADQLRPLVEAAVAGQLSTAEQARLERLLIAYWRKRLELTGCSAAETLVRLREHAESAVPMEQLERWLHRKPGSCRVDVAAVLRPYRDHPPIDRAKIAAEEAPA